MSALVTAIARLLLLLWRAFRGAETFFTERHVWLERGEPRLWVKRGTIEAWFVCTFFFSFAVSQILGAKDLALGFIFSSITPVCQIDRWGVWASQGNRGLFYRCGLKALFRENLTKGSWLRVFSCPFRYELTKVTSFHIIFRSSNVLLSPYS